MRLHLDNSSTAAKSWMNYFTIVSGEQQTMLYYRGHGGMLNDDLARKLYAEIAEIEEQHVSQYEAIGDPNATALEQMTLLQLNEAYNYFSCMQTESNERIRSVWAEFLSHEIEHFNTCNELLLKYEKKDIRDIIKVDRIEPLIVFEPNKEYVNEVLKEQVNLRPLNKRFVSEDRLPSDWKSFSYQSTVNAGGAPSDIVEERYRER
jgi:rubrerythrin